MTLMEERFKEMLEKIIPRGALPGLPSKDAVYVVAALLVVADILEEIALDGVGRTR